MKLERWNLVICAAVFLSASAALAAPCDPNYVIVQHKNITVLPTGADDTTNLQCAIDLAATLGPGVTIQLAEGTFTTEQLVVNGVRGTFKGMGQDATIIHNPLFPMTIDNPDCYTSGSPCFADTPPSAANRHPSLISILGEDVVLSDLAIEMVGDGPSTKPWRMWGSAYINMLSNVVQMLGSYSSLKLERVLISSGIYTGSSGQSAGAFNMWSFSRPWFVTWSSLVIADSTFRGKGAGVYTYNLDQSRVVLRGNRFEVGGASLMISDVNNSQIQASHNEVVGGTGAAFLGWQGNIGTGIVATSLLFDNNLISGNVGFNFVKLLASDDLKCQLVHNDVSQVVTPYKFGTTMCKVVGESGPKQ